MPDINKLENLRAQRNIINKHTFQKLYKNLNDRKMGLTEYLNADKKLRDLIDKEVQPTVADNLVLTHLSIALDKSDKKTALSAINSWIEQSGEAPVKNINVSNTNPFGDLSDDDVNNVLTLLIEMENKNGTN